MAPHSSTLAWKIPWNRGAWWAAGHGVAKSWTRLSDFTFTFHFHALEEEMETHSSVLAWKIPGMVEPCGLPSMGLHRVRHDWSYLAAVDLRVMSRVLSVLCRQTSIFPRGEHGDLLQHSCLENLMDRGAWWATVHRVENSQKQLSSHACYLSKVFLSKLFSYHHMPQLYAVSTPWFSNHLVSSLFSKDVFSWCFYTPPTPPWIFILLPLQA